MNQKRYQRYTAEFKEKALGLLALGKPVAEVAQDLEISTNLLYSWRTQAQGAHGGSVGQLAGGGLAEADAVRALRRENALLRSENDILKKAAIILGSRPQLNSTK
jgi:transposase